MKTLELYREPLRVLNGFEHKGYTGMSEFDLAFLCGALKKFRPRKIVEIGIAAGGTTTVILNCLDLLGCQCDMYSVDISRQCYLDTSKMTGFVAAQYLEEASANVVSHHFILGKTVAAALDEIGTGIDFVILDTMHSLPGELLDFIALYPSLDDRSTIIFHDVGQSQLGIGHINGAPFEYASLITMTTLKGEKYVALDEDSMGGIANIGGVRIDKNMQGSIEDLFFALFINWNYIPDRQSLCEYRERISRDYGDNFCQMFERALECNMFSLYRRKGISFPLGTVKNRLDEALRGAGRIYIYGAGEISGKVRRYIENMEEGFAVTGCIVTEKAACSQKDVFELDEIQGGEDVLILLGLDEKYHLEVLGRLYKRGFSKKVFPYNGIGFREMMEIVKYENELHMNVGEVYENNYGYERWIKKAAGRGMEG